MNRTLSEINVCMKYITPVLQQAGWDIQTQIFREAPLNQLTNGRIHVRGQLYKRGTPKRADYILVVKNIPIAIIEAKKNTLVVSAGMQQALGYAEMLNVLFAYSNNGKAFQEHDKTLTHSAIEREVSLASFPAPEELWSRYKTTNLPSINMMVLRNTPIIVPSCTTQEMIVAEVRRMLRWCQKLEMAIQQREMISKHLMRSTMNLGKK